MPSPRLWILPRNDLEAREIIALLQEQGENVLITQQPWGATWAGLEPEVEAQIASFRQAHPQGQILGVELAGPNPFGARDIDHHRYSGEDRSHPLSSLEQVAAILGVPLDRRRLLVAANDRGYIPAMEELGATPSEIAEIRRLDRAAQGITPEQESRAERDVARAEIRGVKALVRCPDGSTSVHSDLLWGRASEILLVAPDKWSYSGPRVRRLEALGLSESTWSGGRPESGYFGVVNPGPDSQQAILREFWESAAPDTS